MNQKSAEQLPVFYIPHGGGPCFFMDWDPKDAWDSMEQFLRGIANTLDEKPRAILVISAHWEEHDFMLTSHPNPPLLYDYYGFPEHTYKLSYPAAGAPVLAREVATLLKASGISTSEDATRGFDHGVFIPFLLIYPDADIPVIQLSLKQGLDPDTHIRAGEALASLRGQGVLIVGSGMSYHNLRQFGPAGAVASDMFDDWLTQTMLLPNADTRNKTLVKWQQAPAARSAHPREEHLLPLMVIAGAAGRDIGKQIFSDRVMGMSISAYQFGA